MAPLRVVGPVVAGAWYPSKPDELAREVDRLLERARVHPGAPVRALIEPHAGFTYSGAVAAHGFRHVQGKAYSRVILLGPSHYAAFRGAALPPADVYRTPLGDVPLDVDSLRALAKVPGFATMGQPFEPEHCLEAEVPFLQRSLVPGWHLLPVLIGSGSAGPSAQEVADGIRPYLDAETLIVVSSDFTHFGRGFGYVPFDRDVPDRIRELDLGAVGYISAGDFMGFGSYLDRTGATICGRDAIDVLLRLLPMAARGSLVSYATSGQMTGDWGHTVSYAAIVFHHSPS